MASQREEITDHGLAGGPASGTLATQHDLRTISQTKKHRVLHATKSSERVVGIERAKFDPSLNVKSVHLAPADETESFVVA